MIKLPDFDKVWDYENNFYLSCHSSRMSKIISHYELYKIAENITGDIIECGVFKGVSLCRFAMFRDLFGNYNSKRIIGFDTFSKFPETKFNIKSNDKHYDNKPTYWKDDEEGRKKHIEISQESISKEQLYDVLHHKNINELELVEGDITETIPKYVKEHPDLKISLLNLDVDIYEPTVTILEYLYPRIEKGGVLILDDYGKFPGETKAIDDYFKGKNIEIKKFSFCTYPRFIIKP